MTLINTHYRKNSILCGGEGDDLCNRRCSSSELIQVVCAD